MNRNPDGRIPPEQRPDFRSYERATWRDWDNVEHQRYFLRRMANGSGFEIVDTDNGTESVVQTNFADEEAAQNWMRMNRAP